MSIGYYEFGPFQLDVPLSRLRRGEELLWPNTFVEDANLTQHIYPLRRVRGARPRRA